MTKKLKTPTLLWLGACAVVLIWWMAVYGLNERTSDALKSEAMIYVVIAMTLLSFPVGLVWTIVIAGGARLLHAAGIDMHAPIWVSLLFYWVGALVLGYLQWFLIVPRIKAKREGRSQQSVR